MIYPKVEYKEIITINSLSHKELQQLGNDGWGLTVFIDNRWIFVRHPSIEEWVEMYRKEANKCQPSK